MAQTTNNVTGAKEAIANGHFEGSNIAHKTQQASIIAETTNGDVSFLHLLMTNAPPTMTNHHATARNRQKSFRLSCIHQPNRPL